ncbi:DUF3179 domain-containing protein [bacterium]|nr:DUF3179 domain-containing protein [bacterium]
MSKRRAENGGRHLAVRLGGFTVIGSLLLFLLSMRLPDPVSFKICQASRMNGFSLAELLVPREHIQSQELTRDEIVPLDMPEVVDAEGLAELNFDRQSAGQPEFLDGPDRIVGLELNGESRAYPVSLLAIHQVVNDELGGVPLLVSYCPWCDAVLVFDRRVGDDTLLFAASGLLYSSNMLMYDRTERRGQESLWCQLQGRAVSGPQAVAGATLSMLPAELLNWGGWLAIHPDTEVAVVRDAEESPLAMDFDAYYLEAKLRYPAWPRLSGSSPLHAFERVVAVGNESGWTVYPLRQLEQELGSGSWLEMNGAVFSLSRPVEHIPATVQVVPADGADVRIAYSLWFAWYAMHPESEIFPVLE